MADFKPERPGKTIEAAGVVVTGVATASNRVARLGRRLLALLPSRFLDDPDQALLYDDLFDEPDYSLAFKITGASVVYLLLGAFTMASSWLLNTALLNNVPYGVNLSGWWPREFIWWTGLVLSGASLTGFAASVFMLRVLLRARARAAVQADTARAADPQFRDVERIRLERTQVEERLFKRNLNHLFYLRQFEWSGISFFEDGDYRFAPRVNVLLGKNGYGKTLLFRALTAMIQRSGEHSGQLFPPPATPATGTEPRLTVEMTRNDTAEQIIRDTSYFADSVGKIPMLAIPDSRFINRTRRTVSGAISTSEGLASAGAKSYLTQEPFENVVQDLLTQLCLEYGDVGTSSRGRTRGFDRYIFRLVEEVVSELTADQEFRFTEIRRIGSVFEILVRSSGSQDMPIPIQFASQGTLSVVAIFGLIYEFLHSLRRDLPEDKVPEAHGIVLIDEIDAHLHPSWQQKIMAMLVRKFPNVQFIVSAHSPAIVAGCDKGEVSIIRKRPDTGKFYIETRPEDFLGVTVGELYERVFEIEDFDRLYLEFTAADATRQEQRERDIERLEQKRALSPQEEQTLGRLHRDSRLASRAGEMRDRRLKAVANDTRAAMMQSELEQMRYLLHEKETELKRLAEAACRPATKGGDAVPA